MLELGFATFFLNRTNRSGIVTGRPIGGMAQEGKWNLTARYNKADLIKRVRRIAGHRDHVTVYRMEARDFIRRVLPSVPGRGFAFIDPPYYGRGSDLYRNTYMPRHHQLLARCIAKSMQHKWIVTYDDSPDIRAMYAGFRQKKYALSYSAASRYVGAERLIVCPGLRIPRAAARCLPRWVPG